MDNTIYTNREYYTNLSKIIILVMTQKKSGVGKWKTISSKTVYQNPWIKVREDKIIHPNGKEGIYGVVEIPPGIFVIAQNEQEEILLIKQMHYPTGLSSWELPGGGLKPGHTHEEQACEELEEEALMTATSFLPLGKTQTQPGITNQIDYYFLAKDLKHRTSNNLEEMQQEEGITSVRFFPLVQVDQMIIDGSLNHAQSITGYTLFKMQSRKI